VVAAGGYRRNANLVLDARESIFTRQTGIFMVGLCYNEHVQILFGGEMMRTLWTIMVISIIYIGIYDSAQCQNIDYLYTKQEIVTLSYGKDPGEIGYYEPITGSLNTSPSMITVDSTGNIYLFDGNNNRIQVFNADGELINYFAFPGHIPYGQNFYICLDEDNDYLYIHIGYANKFYVYSKSGKLIRTINYNGLLPARFFVEKNIVNCYLGYIDINDYTTDVNNVSEKQENIIVEVKDDEGFLEENNNMIRGKYSNNNYLKLSPAEFEIIKENKLSRNINFSDMAPSYVIEFAGETIKEDVVFWGYPALDKKLPYIILKFNKNLDLISKIKDDMFKKRTRYSTVYNMKMTEDGTIYTLYIDSEGAKILKWIME
jgi:hypothetical protein